MLGDGLDRWVEAYEMMAKAVELGAEDAREVLSKYRYKSTSSASSPL